MAEKNTPDRPVRIPLGTRNVLTAPKREGYVRRFVNDTDGRVKDFEAAGYTVVREDIEVGDPKAGKPQKVGSAVSPSVGGGTKAVLMEIREDWHEEDKKKKQDEILRVENEMKRNLNSRKAGTYGSVEIQ